MPKDRTQSGQQNSRLHLLYRIPPAPARGRLLELSTTGEPVIRRQAWAGESAELRSAEDLACADRLPQAYYDLVVLHGTLDHLWAAAPPRERHGLVRRALERVAASLASGGVVAGCVQNRHFLNVLLRSPRRTILSATAFSPLSVVSCRSELQAAGFGDLMLFSILPGLDSPQRLVSLDNGWSWRACARQVDAMRPYVGPSAYALWRGLAMLGVSRYLGAATFFWGRRDC